MGQLGPVPRSRPPPGKGGFGLNVPTNTGNIINSQEWDPDY
jgi:hypothetical protein